MSAVPISELVNVEEFYQHWKSAPDITEKINSKIFSISTEFQERLNRDSNVENLSFPGELTSLEEILHVVPPRDQTSSQPLNTITTLRSLQIHPPLSVPVLPDEANTLPVNGNQRPRLSSKLNERPHPPGCDKRYNNSREEAPNCPDVLDDVVLTVLIFKPIADPSRWIVRETSFVIQKRIDVLGSQTLSDLREMIHCPQDYLWLGDCSECLDDHSSHVTAKELYPSCYFFIENVFYNNVADGTRDISESVIKWARKSLKRSEQMGQLSCSSLQSTKFRQLNIRVGKCYLYLHQGSCEHFLVFSDIRMANRLDCQSPSKYPITTGTCIPTSLHCRACLHSVARWIVRGSSLLPEDPCLMCTTCLKMLLYTPEGTKKGDFTVSMFIGEEAIL